MKRRLLTILIFLLAGAVVNVAVAWGCAVLVPLGAEYGQDAAEPSHREPHSSGRLLTWRVYRFRRAGAVFVMSMPQVQVLGDAPRAERRPTDLLPFWFPKHDLQSNQMPHTGRGDERSVQEDRREAQLDHLQLAAARDAKVLGLCSPAGR